MHFSSPPFYATCPPHLILLDVITLNSVKSEDHEAPHYVIFSILLKLQAYTSRYTPQPFFSNAPNLFPSLRVRDQVSHLYKAAGKIIGF
jgi:hypothetical protein